MTSWIKIQNSMPAHPKFVTAGARAAWLFVCGLCYSNEHLTDGFVPSHVLVVVAPGIRNGIALAKQLVRVGLWHEVDGGWQIHDYDRHQRSSEEVLTQRERDRKRKMSARTPSGIHAESAGNPDGVRVNREEKSREELATQVTRKRATRPKVDQSAPPENFPDEHRETLRQVVPILHGVWDVRGGVEPQERGVGLAILRNPRADHLNLARRLEHWLLAGRGQRARCADIAARFGDWVEGEHAELRVIDGGGKKSASDLLNAMWDKTEEVS